MGMAASSLSSSSSSMSTIGLSLPISRLSFALGSGGGSPRRLRGRCAWGLSAPRAGGSHHFGHVTLGEVLVRLLVPLVHLAVLLAVRAVQVAALGFVGLV